jgi:hypothetical protein
MALTTRRRALTTLAAAVAGSVAVPAYAQASEGGYRPRPLWRAHAHNDYLHPVPSSTRSTTASGASSRTSSSSGTSSSSPTTRSTSTRPEPWNPSTSPPSPPA